MLSKKVLKLYKTMHYLEKMKHLEPNMTSGFHNLAKSMYFEYKDSRSQERMSNSSNGFIEALSNSQFKISDELSNVGSELSIGHSAIGFKNNLETI